MNPIGNSAYKQFIKGSCPQPDPKVVDKINTYPGMYLEYFPTYQWIKDHPEVKEHFKDDPAYKWMDEKTSTIKWVLGVAFFILMLIGQGAV